MRYYIEYYHKGAVSGDLIPACGDRATIVIDGRIKRLDVALDIATRNGHGAGFWDRGKPYGDELSEISKSFGNAWIYLGDDDKVYLEH